MTLKVIAEHSPGPWTREKRFDGRTQIVREDGSIIAWLNESGDTEGNARLLAGAPKMLSALMAIAEMRTGGDTNGAELAALCVAIARTTLEAADGA